ncbi:NUDIX domain-containing protein [Nonomuraea jabiensis]|uniref:NUDIX domain-containing protein n=1 Tax=Nonomuraea jabiensis TaxID=882448 RepID=UPI003422E7B6
MATVAWKVEEETGYRPKQVEHLVSYQPVAGRVDSERVLFLVRGAELVGKPEGEVEADRIEWVPMAEIPGMIAPGDIWTAGTLIGPLQAQQRLNGRGRLTARRTNRARQGPVHKHGPSRCIASFLAPSKWPSGRTRSPGTWRPSWRHLQPPKPRSSR